MHVNGCQQHSQARVITTRCLVNSPAALRFDSPYETGRKHTASVHKLTAAWVLPRPAYKHSTVRTGTHGATALNTTTGKG